MVVSELFQVIGYPIGGDNICVTRGIVSRIDTMSYSTRPLDNTPELLVVQVSCCNIYLIIQVALLCELTRGQ